MKKTLFSLLLVIIILFSSCTVNTKGNVTTQTTDNITTLEAGTTSEKPFYTKEIKTDVSDPYSSLIKEKCDYITSFWKDVNTEDKKRGFDYYIKDFEDLYYFLYDLDKDGTNELLFGTLQRVGTDFEDIYAPKKFAYRVFIL